MSGEMIAILAMGVALAGVILTSLRGTLRRGWMHKSKTCVVKWVNSESAWRIWKGCWKEPVP